LLQGWSHRESHRKLRMTVYPSNKAAIHAKLCQNAFQTIPDVSFFDGENLISAKKLGLKIPSFANLARFWRSHSRTDLKIRFLVKFCSRYTDPEACMTKNWPKYVRTGFAVGRGRFAVGRQKTRWVWGLNPPAAKHLLQVPERIEGLIP